MSVAANKRRENARARVVKSSWENNEPRFNPMDYSASMTKCLNFYNSEIDSKDKQDWTIRYWKEQGRKISDLRKVSAGYFNQTGALVRLIQRGVALEEQHMHYLDKKYDELLSFAKVEEVEDAKESGPKRKTVQEILKDQATDAIAEIDGFLDEILTSGKTEEDIGKWIKSRRFTGPVVKHMQAYFSHAISDVKNPDGYCTGRKYSALRNAYAAIEDALGVLKAAKVQKPRVKKQKPAAELVKTFKYQQEFDTMKSEHPTKIVGAKEIYLFDSAKRKLTQLVAIDGYQLSVKGTTVINIDPEKSFSKVVRKPEILKSMKTAGVRAIRNTFRDIRAVSRPAIGRTNENTFILAIF